MGVSIYLFLLGVTIAWGLFSSSIAIAGKKDSRSWQASDYQVREIKDRTVQITGVGVKPGTYSFDLDIEGVYPNPKLPLILVVTYNKKEVEADVKEYGAALPWYDCEAFLIDLKTGEGLPFDGFTPDSEYKREETTCTNAIRNIWSKNGTYALLGYSAVIVNAKDLPALLKGEDAHPKQITGSDQTCVGAIENNSWDWVTDSVVSFSGGACGTFFDYLFDVDTGKLDIYCAKSQKPGYGCPENFFKPASEYLERVQRLRRAAFK